MLESENRELRIKLQEAKRVRRQASTEVDKFKLEKEDLLEFLRQLDYVLCQAAQHESRVRDMVKAKLAYETASSSGITIQQ